MKSAKKIMVVDPWFCDKQQKLINVVTEMLKYSIGSLPVVDDENKVIGIITDRDVCTVLARTGKNLEELKVGEAMTHPVYTCRVEDDLNRVLKIMRTKQVGRLPVVDKEGKLAGIISLNRIVRELHGTNEGAEVVYGGKENVVNTLHSIAERNHHMSFEYGDFDD